MLIEQLVASSVGRETTREMFQSVCSHFGGVGAQVGFKALSALEAIVNCKPNKRSFGSTARWGCWVSFPGLGTQKSLKRKHFLNVCFQPRFKMIERIFFYVQIDFVKKHKIILKAKVNYVCVITLSDLYGKLGAKNHQEERLLSQRLFNQRRAL